MSTDPYDALGLDKSVTAAKIKKAYRRIAKQCHPDLNPDDAGAEARFKAAAAAYDLLKDPKTRARFDRGEIDASGTERPERQFYRDFAHASDNPYQSGRGYGPQGFGDFDQDGDIFEQFLRRQAGAQPGAGAGRGYGARGFSARGPDMRYALEVPFLTAARGGKTRITLPDGQSLEVNIPEGSHDGQTIRLRGKGGAGFGGGPAGDALVTLSLAPHPIFRREGSDIIVTLPITLDEAVLGGKAEVPTISGPVKLTIPKGASGGQVLRLRGRGVTPAGSKPPGDQRVELRIVTPPEIDQDLQDFMQQWRKTRSYDPRKGMKA